MESLTKMNRQQTQDKERQKKSFLKEQVENVDLRTTNLNKVMATHEECIKYNFAAPLTLICISEV